MATDASKQPTIGQRQARFGATAGLYTLIVILILVAVNWLAREPRFNKTFDTTANKRFTLSDETQKVIKGLKSPATITYFDKKNDFQNGKTMLDRYRNLSDKIEVKYIDPRQEPTLAISYGVHNFGVAFIESNGRKEEARSLTEEGLTGAFLKVLKGVRKVCTVKGNGERSFDAGNADSLANFKNLLERDNYETQAITLLNKTSIPPECNVTIVAGPRSDYSANEVSALKQSVENGGRILFLLDPPFDFGKEHTSDNSELTNLLASWGVTVDKDLVLEQNLDAQAVGVGPETPLVFEYQSHPIVNDLKGHTTGFQLIRSLEVKNGAKTTVSKLFSTTDSAVATTDLTNPAIQLTPQTMKKGPFVLAAAGDYDTGSPSKPGRFVVLGSSTFIAGGTFGLSFQANRDLALNIVNWLSSDEDLISIRPKDSDNRTMNPSSSQMATFEYTDVIAIPLMIIVIGVAVYMKRR